MGGFEIAKEINEGRQKKSSQMQVKGDDRRQKTICQKSMIWLPSSAFHLTHGEEWKNILITSSLRNENRTFLAFNE